MRKIQSIRHNEFIMQCFLKERMDFLLNSRVSLERRRETTVKASLL